jgi:coenzyme F420-0:L-glutamate ligase/coenzyme F420-1:gamma-L-glutamate ligase
LGIGEVTADDDLAALLWEAIGSAGVTLESGDVVVVTHKVVSKAEGAVVALLDHDATAHRELVEEQSQAVLRRRGDLIIAVTKHGFVCANAGVDRSNVAAGTAVLLPRDPDRSARRIRFRLEAQAGVQLGVVITDTFGRPWRRGLVDVAIGVSGLPAIVDHRGQVDTWGRVLQVTEVAIVDEIAAAADLAMGKATGIPAVIVRGLELPPGDGRAQELIRPASEDLFR